MTFKASCDKVIIRKEEVTGQNYFGHSMDNSK